MINLNNANEVVRKILTAIQTLAEARFKPEYFTRKRTMPFSMLLEFMLINYKESTQAALQKYFKFKGKDDVHMSLSRHSAKPEISSTIRLLKSHSEEYALWIMQMKMKCQSLWGTRFLL